MAGSDRRVGAPARQGALRPSAHSSAIRPIRLPSAAAPARALDLALAFFWDAWHRQQVRRLVEKRGLPAAVVRLAWDALPYEPVRFRFGWERWRELRVQRLGPKARPRTSV